MDAIKIIFKGETYNFIAKWVMITLAILYQIEFRIFCIMYIKNIVKPYGIVR